MLSVKSILLLLVCCMGGCFTVAAQQVIFSQKEVDKMYEIPAFGVNRSQFVWLKLDPFGMNLTDGSGDAKVHFSDYFGLTVKYKLKLSQIVSYGFGLGYNHQTYMLTSDGIHKIDPDEMNYDKGKMMLNSFDMSTYIRFNLDRRRGNIMGWYADLGIFGQWDFDRKMKYKNQHGNDKVSLTTHPQQLENFAAGASLHVGHNWLGLFLKYKMFSFATYPEGAPELMLPKFTLGLELNIYNP